MTLSVQHADFVGEGTARLFLMIYAPRDAAPPRRCFVVAPAFAEEMNRSRDVLRTFGQAAAEAGAATVIPDLRGTGDSPGHFGHYGVTDWCDDLLNATSHARERFGNVPVTLLGIRFGALLANRIMASASIDTLLLWQPVTEGRRLVREFLRVWSAANMGTGGDARSLLERDGMLEIAGYKVTRELVGDLESLTLSIDAPRRVRIRWIEAGAALSARGERKVGTVRDAGHDVQTAVVNCPPFWRVQERVDASAFVDASNLDHSWLGHDG